jgi:hypothetical protein
MSDTGLMISYNPNNPDESGYFYDNEPYLYSTEASFANTGYDSWSARNYPNAAQDSNSAANNGLLSKLQSLIPSLCSGGGFGYGSANIPLAPKVSIESIGLVEYDSKQGGSHGGVLGLEVGPTVTGVEFP